MTEKTSCLKFEYDNCQPGRLPGVADYFYGLNELIGLEKNKFVNK
jgi:hypothetical protein